MKDLQLLLGSLSMDNGNDDTRKQSDWLNEEK